MSQSLDQTMDKRLVPQAFNRVAKRYDLLQRLNPGYVRHLRMSAKRLELRPRARILDLCCGTGISTRAICDTYGLADVDGLDASEGMLEEARRRDRRGRVRFVLGDAMNPAEAGLHGPYDGILMAYGIRNMPAPDVCLQNLLALLEPGGAICFHEYSVADSAVSRAVWHAVAHGIIIPLGAITSPGSDIYRYLWRSVLTFDGVGAFENRLRRVGFADVRTEPMDSWARGIVHSFLARRPE